MKNTELVSLKDALNTERSTAKEVWDLVERTTLPFTGEFYRKNTSENSLEWLMSRRIFDTTSVMGCQLLAADLHANMSSDASKWNKYIYANQASNDIDEKVRWLEDSDELVNSTIIQSNFSLEVSAMYLGMVGYGPSVLSMEETNEDPLNWDGVTYTGVPLKESYWVESAVNGRPLIFIRSLMMTPVQMVDKWGKDVPQGIKEKAQTTDGHINKQEVLFCVYPREGKVDKGKIVKATERPFAWKYVIYDSKEMVGKEGGYYSMQVYIPRWARHIDSKFGYSPTILALGSILTANRIIEMELAAGSKAIDPTILVNQGNIWGSLQLGSGTANVVNDVNGVRVLESGARLDIADNLLDQQQEQIRNFFYTNYIQLKESPQMTAYETAQRIRQTQKFLGPTYGRLTNDLFDPMLKDVFWMHSRAGKLPKMPESIAKDQDEIKIEYIGPLALAQKGQTSNAIKMFLQGMTSLAEAYPQVLDIPDIDAAAKQIAQLDGVPISIINDDAVIKKARKAKADRVAQAQQIAMAQAGGDAAQSVAKAQQMGAEG